VTETIDIYPSHCPDCQIPLGAELADVRPLVRTFVWELPEIVPEITAYVHHTVSCPQCQAHIWQDRRPKDAPPGSFGPRLSALLGLLRGPYHQSTRLVASFCTEVLGIPISTGSIARSCERVSVALEPIDAVIHQVVQAQEVANVDETSWREAHKRCWLWTMTTGVATSFRIQAQRSRAALESLLGQSEAIIGSDRYGAYLYLPDRRRQLCWSHLERNVQALADYGHEESSWAEALLAECDQLWACWHQYRDGTGTHAGLQQALVPIQAAIRARLIAGQSQSWTKIQSFSTDLLGHWEALWTFARVEGVEPTNNAAERVLRGAVIARKLSYGTQSAEGSRFVERMLSVATTCRQQGRAVFAFLTDALQTAWAGRSAPVLVVAP
jgi:transposase